MQITKVTLAGMVLVCGLSSASYGVQLLTNRGFQTVPDHSVGWTFSNTNVEVKEYPNSFWSPGPVPSGNGSWGLEAVSNGTSSNLPVKCTSAGGTHVARGLIVISGGQVGGRG